MPKPVTITEHALLRYLERILELDLDAMRKRLEQDIRAAAHAGAKTITIDGATFVLQPTPVGGICVVTVLTQKMRRDSHRRNERRKWIETSRQK